MICDYVILEISSSMFIELCQSGFKRFISDIFTLLILKLEKSEDINNNLVALLDKRGHIEFYDKGIIYVLCKCWNYGCYNCGKPTKTYRINSDNRLCEDCANIVLKEKQRKNKIPLREELISQLA